MVFNVGGRNHLWWFETLGGDKTQSFISRTKAYRHKKLTIHTLSFSL
jgi:hypothetical protein